MISIKLLSIKVSGLKLIEDNTEIKFFAQQRVSEEEISNMYYINDRVFLNPVSAFIGINASGKTTTLRLIAFVADLIKCIPLNFSENRGILEGGINNRATITSYFLAGDFVIKLETVIKQEVTVEGKIKFIIEDEIVYRKSIKSVRSKKSLLDFESSHIILKRETDDLISDDVSIYIKFYKQNKENLSILNFMSQTNFNFIVTLFPSKNEKSSKKAIPVKILNYLDPSIEELYLDDNNLIHLKFYNQNEILLTNAFQLESYLSSGTMKGANNFVAIVNTLIFGGILLIDEIENHYNKEIVKTIIKLFDDEETNKNGAMLVFSTHYHELLDFLHRNDQINIVRRAEKIRIDNLSLLLNRTDLKRSEVYESDRITGTAPNYQSYLNFRK